jgi:hypothetical protein
LLLVAQAAWLRLSNSTLVASLKKYSSDFFNADFIGTEPTNVLYVQAGVKCEKLEH